MDNKDYVLDKRKVKKILAKYGTIFLLCFPILIGISFALEGVVARGWKITIMIVAGLAVFGICELVTKNFKIKKEQFSAEQKEIKMQREREEMFNDLTCETANKKEVEKPKKTTSKSRKKQKELSKQEKIVDENAGREKVSVFAENKPKQNGELEINSDAVKKATTVKPKQEKIVIKQKNKK